MQPSIDSPVTREKKWVYASLTVLDADRKLKPTHVSFDHVRFNQPPHLISTQIEVIVANGDHEQRTMAEVLPHDEDATFIPIRLLKK